MAWKKEPVEAVRASCKDASWDDLPLEVLRAHPSGKDPRVRPKTHQRDYISWASLGAPWRVPHKEPESMVDPGEPAATTTQTGWMAIDWNIVIRM